jgi:hypothetical protein
LYNPKLDWRTYSPEVGNRPVAHILEEKRREGRRKLTFC